jgi:hypothetical protein
MIVVVGIERIDTPRNFRTDIDLITRRQRAGRADRDRKRALNYIAGDILLRLAAAENPQQKNDKHHKTAARDEQLLACNARRADIEAQLGDHVGVGDAKLGSRIGHVWVRLKGARKAPMRKSYVWFERCSVKVCGLDRGMIPAKIALRFAGAQSEA